MSTTTSFGKTLAPGHPSIPELDLIIAKLRKVFSSRSARRVPDLAPHERKQLHYNLRKDMLRIGLANRSNDAEAHRIADAVIHILEQDARDASNPPGTVRLPDGHLHAPRSFNPDDPFGLAV